AGLLSSSWSTGRTCPRSRRAPPCGSAGGPPTAGRSGLEEGWYHAAQHRHRQHGCRGGPVMGRVTLMSVAHPWHCDQMGHMNVRYYSALFDDAGFQFLGHLAGPGAPEQLGWADVRSEVHYRNETAAGTLLTVTTSV